LVVKEYSKTFQIDVLMIVAKHLQSSVASDDATFPYYIRKIILQKVPWYDSAGSHFLLPYIMPHQQHSWHWFGVLSIV